jgi:hypothetical protein
MIFLSKRFFYSIFILFCFLGIDKTFATSFILGRIHFPDSATLEAVKTEIQERKTKKYIMASTTVATTLAALYGFACIRKVALQRKDVLSVSKNNDKEKSQEEMSENNGFLNWFLSISIMDFALDSSKFLADAGTVFAAGTIISFLYDFVYKKMVDMYKDETISWFILHQTKLKSILADIKERVIGYDLHSELLSSEISHLKKEVHLEAFVSDICQNLSESKNNSSLKEVNYYQTIMKNLEKKYKDEFSSLDELQTYATQILSKKKRSLLDDNKTDLFNGDNQLRMDIAFLCDLFITEFTHMLAFIQIHKGQQQVRVSDLIDISNQFLDQIEAMLNMSKNEWNELSKKNRGFFTVVYEYEKLFDQQIVFLDRYCNCSSL